MIVYPKGYSVTVQIPFKDLGGNLVTPVSVTATVMDTEGNLIFDLGSVSFTPGQPDTSVLVPGIYNTIEPDAVTSGRVVLALIETANGTIPVRTFYMVQDTFELALMKNSFLSYEGAIVESVNLFNIAGWNASTEIDRKKALTEAYIRITRIPMKYNPRDVDGTIMRNYDVYIPSDIWEELSADDYLEMPTHFRRALRRAQVLEANEILLGDVIAVKRRMGITSEKIGESSVSLNVMIHDYGLSSDALAALAGYIDNSPRLARG